MTHAVGRSSPITTTTLAVAWAILMGCGGGEVDRGPRAPATGPAPGAINGGGVNAPNSSLPPVPSIGTNTGPALAAAGAGAPASCVGLQCQQHTCPGGASTRISGKVFDPAGKNPLYDVVVYVPNAPVEALKSGASCDSCNSLYTGMPIAAGLTDAAGNFSLENAPDGANIPLVVQIGKWRKQTLLANVAACRDNPQPDGTLRLPRNRSEGDIPNIAISTGGADTLECLLRRIGVDASEYVAGPGAQGRIHIFQGSDLFAGIAGAGGSTGGTTAPTTTAMCRGGICVTAPNTSPAAPRSSAALWVSASELMNYDIVLLSCEGQETQGMNQQALHDYASAGGRVFASHFHYAWFNTGPYASENLATWSAGANDIGNIQATIVTMLPNAQAFPKGQALRTWLENVKAVQGGALPIQQARHNADVGASNTPSQAWIVADMNASTPGATQYFSFNTPTNLVSAPDHPAQECGRVVFSDLHVGAASGDDRAQPVPIECSNVDLSPQEKALEFMLFDLSSCVIPDNRPPEPPAIAVPQ